MLSDDDRRTLRELERRLAAEDAPFVRQFVAPHRRQPSSGHLPAQILGALVLGGLMLLAGSMAGAVAFFGAGAAVALAWWHAQDPNTGHDDRPAPEPIN